MLKSTNKLFVLILLLMFLGCQKEEEIENTVQEAEKVLPKSVVTKTDNQSESPLLNDLGLTFESDKIIIDINKTEHFFETFEKRIEEKIHNADINVTRDAGVTLKEEEITIDLNKTKKLLDNLSNLFETILFDDNRTIP